jgi:hypothetical protein
VSEWRRECKEGIASIHPVRAMVIVGEKKVMKIIDQFRRYFFSRLSRVENDDE